MIPPNKTRLDYPFEEVREAMIELFSEGHTVYQKWTCVGCRRRCTNNVPNAICETLHCEDCGADTNVKKRGCNYMLIMVVPK